MCIPGDKGMGMLGPLREYDPSRLGPWLLSGRLGLGQTWSANDDAGRFAVVRETPARLADRDVQDQFARDAEAAAQVVSPWTADVYEVNLGNDPAYVAEEYVPGMTLADHIEQHGPLDQAQAVAFAAALADGLAAMHRADVVHRDLSPRNIIMSFDGPRIVNLGAAGDHTSSDTAATSRAAMSMAPELFAGSDDRQPADVFAWGVNLCLAASGQHPFGSGRAEAVAYRIVHDEPAVTNLPDALDDLVRAALSKAPAQRPRAADGDNPTVLATQLVRSTRLRAYPDEVTWPPLMTASRTRPRWLIPAGAAVSALALAAGTAAFLEVSPYGTEVAPVAAEQDEPVEDEANASAQPDEESTSEQDNETSSEHSIPATPDDAEEEPEPQDAADETESDNEPDAEPEADQEQEPDKSMEADATEEFDIRDVDWAAQTWVSDCNEAQQPTDVTLSEVSHHTGEHALADGDMAVDSSQMILTVFPDSVEYVDVTGNGTDDAAFRAECFLGNDVNSIVMAWSADNGRLTQLPDVVEYTKRDGAIEAIVVREDQLVVRTAEPEPSNTHPHLNGYPFNVETSYRFTGSTWTASELSRSDASESEQNTSSGSDSPAGTYGSDPELDELWHVCADGEIDSCYSLFFASPLDSEYSDFGATCGYRADWGACAYAD